MARAVGGWELNKNHANRRFGLARSRKRDEHRARLPRSAGPPTLHANEGNARREGTKGGRDARGKPRGKGYSSSSSKPSRAKKRNGRKTAFIKLSADVHTLLSPPPCIPIFVRLSPRENYGLSLGQTLPSSTSLLATLFCNPPPVRNSWPPLPPWNEVGMCKIVPRYALHHRVASSPSALFLPLAFFRFPFISALLSIFRAFSRACFFWLLSILATLHAFFSFLTPLDLLHVFLLNHLIPFFLHTFFLPAYISCSLSLYFSIFLFSALISLSSHFSSGSFYLLPIHFPFSFYLCPPHFFRFLFFFLSVHRFLLKNPLCIPFFWSK